MSIMLQPLRVIFLHFGLKNRKMLPNMNFIHGQFNHLNKKKKKNQIRILDSLQNLYIFYISHGNIIMIYNRSKGLLAYMFFTARVKWQFFVCLFVCFFFFLSFFRGRRFFSQCQDRYLTKVQNSLSEHFVVQAHCLISAQVLACSHLHTTYSTVFH